MIEAVDFAMSVDALASAQPQTVRRLNIDAAFV